MKNRKLIKYPLLFILAVILVSVIMMCVSVWGYQQNFGHRVEYSAEGNAAVFEQLSDIKREEITFDTEDDVHLKGYIYTGKQQAPPKAMIVFVHGFGGTHQWGPYLKEYSYFIDHGYSVFAYDNTGCGMSEGSSMVGLGRSVIDLDHALDYIEKTQDLPLLLYGHSWGAFTVSAVLNNDHNITVAAARSGFNSGSEIVFERGKHMVGNLMYLSAPFTTLYEKHLFGKYADYTAADGINRSNIPVLIMHSKDDEEVPYELSIAAEASEITNPYVKIHVYENKKHDITLSDKALSYRASKQKEWEKLNKKYSEDIPQNIVYKYHSNYDYPIAEELDPDVMNEITVFFDESLSQSGR